MLFSQRKGFKPIKSLLQIDDIDNDLRNALWNVLHLKIWEKQHNTNHHYNYLESSNLKPLFQLYWHSYFKNPIDNLPRNLDECINIVRTYFFSCEWHDVYDFIEFTADNTNRAFVSEYIQSCNIVLEREMSGYRFIENKIVEISSEEEITSIENALNNTQSMRGANTHLQTSLDLLSDRKNPDYRNSIKESISAVESISQTLTGDSNATLGAALKILERKSAIHPALKTSLSSLYGYTSDSDGIRHAMLEESTLTFTDAKFMLVACTAFINYMVGKVAENT